MTGITSIRLGDGSLLRVETSAPAPAPVPGQASSEDPYEPVRRPFSDDDGEEPYENIRRPFPDEGEEEEPYEPIRRRRPAGDEVAGAADTLRSAVDRVRPAVSDIVDSLRSMPRRPDRITLEFGVKVTAEAGVVVARTAAEAHFTVGVEWEAAPAQPPAPGTTAPDEASAASSGGAPGHAPAAVGTDGAPTGHTLTAAGTDGASGGTPGGDGGGGG